MLDYHRNDQNIFLIGGYNKMQSWKTFDCDYFYSHLVVYGVATWKRAWRHYDFNMSDLENLIEQIFSFNLWTKDWV